MYRQSVVVAPTREYAAVVADLSVRAQHVRAHRVDPRQDNLLRIFTDQRAAALDLRLLGRTPSGPGKVDAVAARISALHDTAGVGLQIVYADLGAPTSTGWNLYDELRDQLMTRGVPPAQIRYLHQVRNEAERIALLDDCRTGRVSVLITNSRRMPADIPAAALALHHLDCPVSANDLRRREGHANAAGGVRVFRYIIAGSYETRAWQTIDVAAASRPVSSAAASAFRPLTDVHAVAPPSAPAAIPGPASTPRQHPERHR